MARKYLDTTGLTALWAKVKGFFVKKSGDTMTGNLTIAGQELRLGTSSTSSNDSGDIVWYYGNGQEKARIWTDDTPTGYAESRPNFRSYKSDGTALHNTQLATASDVNDAVKKSGDTMTGALTMNNVNVNVKDTDIKVGTVPSSTVWGNGLYAQSNNAGDLWYIRSIQDTSDNVGVQLEVQRTINGTRYYHDMRMGIANNGAITTSLSNPASWRSALGLGTMATQNTGSWQPAWANNTLYPIGDDVKIGDQNVRGTLVVQGANADGDVQIRKQNGSIITSLRSVYNNQLTSSVSFTRSHASVSYQEGLVCNRYGNVVTFAGYFSCGATIGANTTLYSGLPKPAGGKAIYFTWSGYDFYLHPTDGTIRTNGQIVSRTYVGTFTYVCA